MTPKAQSSKDKTDTLRINIKNCGPPNDLHKSMTRQTIKRYKISANQIHNKGLELDYIKNSNTK
jgi:hypothetical protein